MKMIGKKLFFAAFFWQACLLPLNLSNLALTMVHLCKCSVDGHIHNSCDCNCKHHSHKSKAEKSKNQIESCSEGKFHFAMDILSQHYLYSPVQSRLSLVAYRVLPHIAIFTSFIDSQLEAPS